jgi:hypothetical protein
MAENGFEYRVKVQQIIENQLPEFILDESPKAVDFLKQYYISQEYQGGPIDISDNLDQYLKLDNLTPEVISGSTTLVGNISSTSETITVASTKGFPQKYGLIKIDEEVITYTGITTNTFTGCIRGFSGITDYHEELNSEELVFSESSAENHLDDSEVVNLSSLFLQEFYKKLKFTLTPGLESVDFVSDLNVGNFIKESKTLYQSKGTEESFRILFNVLFGETPKVIDLEKYLIKPSSADYVRRRVVVAERISGNPLLLQGQTIRKSTDPDTTASVSEVEILTRKGKSYYKLLLFIGNDDSSPTITGSFNITGSTRVLEDVLPNSDIITVDSTIGFPESGVLYSGDNVITYTSKSINQFFGCSGINYTIETAQLIRSDEIYYGYENGDTTKKVEFRLTGVLSNFINTSQESSIDVGEKITVKNLGVIIENPINKSKKEVFANSWIYNTSSRYQIESFASGQISQVNVKSNIDKSSLSVGDVIEILGRDSEIVVASDLTVTQILDEQVTTSGVFSLVSGLDYDIRRKVKKASSSIVPIEFGNNSVIANVQNVYEENEEFMYVASNSLPAYEIDKNIFKYTASSVSGLDEFTKKYSIIEFESDTSFLTGNEVVYQAENSPIPGLVEGIYYIEVLANLRQIRLYASKSFIGSENYLQFEELTPGSHNFTLSAQKEGIISPQKLLRKFPISQDTSYQESDETTPGSVGMLVNGVEIANYKSDNSIFYGGISSVDVLNNGEDYDVINPPLISVSSGSAKIQPIVRGSVKTVYVDPQDFDIDKVVSINLTGGNGSGASFEPVINKTIRELNFDAREIIYGGGIDASAETITFSTEHSLNNGQAIIYDPVNNSPIGIGSFGGSNFNQNLTLKDNSTYYSKVINDRTIQIYESYSDYISGINTVGFTTIGTSGIHKFKTEPKNVLTQIKVINGGDGYENRNLNVKPTGISTVNHTVTFNNHGFNDGEFITYEYEVSSIAGLSSSVQYQILKVDEDTFRLSNSGIGGTDNTNYQRRKYVKFGSTGSGYQIFNYPEISLSVEYTSSGIGSTSFRGSLVATPIVRGKIVDTYVYDSGENYGSTILNLNKKPIVKIKNGRSAEFKAIISNGMIEEVIVLYGGVEYYSTPDLKVIGSGNGAVLKPVIVNNKISDVVVINSGSGYSSTDTVVIAVASGKNAVLDAKVREIRINNNLLFGEQNAIRQPSNDLLLSSKNNLQYSVCGYSQSIQNRFGDDGTQHSPIIGWAYDGNPIYGSYGYSDPKDKNSQIKRLVSGYTASLTNIPNRPSGFDLGFFVDDYKFTNSGDLDIFNGRFCITPEFPNGVYAYFATSAQDPFGNLVGQFPYFVGNFYRSKFIPENLDLDQSFDFNNSNLVRNTFPYKLNDPYAGNDFIVESNEVTNQTTVVESVTSGNISDFEIISSGIDYKVGDNLIFDEEGTSGAGLLAQVSRLEGKDITNIQTSVETYPDAIFTWKNGNQIDVLISPQHDINNLDNVTISGFSTELSSLNGFYSVNVEQFNTNLIKDVPAYASTGIVTDIYVSRISENISVGSTITIENETLSVINIFPTQNTLRVVRQNAGAAHTATTTVNLLPNSLSFNKSTNYFDSKLNDVVYFNPKQSLGVGSTVGIGIGVDYKIGDNTFGISVPTQSIYIPDHPFQSNQQIIMRKQGSSSVISVANTQTSTPFDLLSNNNEQVLYAIKKSKDYIGIVTQIGLTTTTNGLFFVNNGSDDYRYSIQSNFNQMLGVVQKIETTVSVSTSHNLLSGDIVNLSIKPNLSVGIGTSTSVFVKYDGLNGKLLINPIQFSSSGITTLTNTITIPNHGLETGDKVIYSANTVASGLTTDSYFVYKIDNSKINLCETYIDSISNPPTVVDITSVGGSNQKISPINPQISVIKNNNLVFDLSDTSLSGYNFKLYYDNSFNNEFISSGTEEFFNVSGVGTAGISANASLTLNYSDNLPNKLYYTLEKSGYISTSDKEVINGSEINFVDSLYNGTYNVSGVGTTTFNLSLQSVPEKLSYSQTECDQLEYFTNSKTASGGINKIRTISPGFNFKKLPVFLGADSSSGSGAYIVARSNSIGKINETRILNEGFEYSSDKTLKPTALIPFLATIESSNQITSINILDGGKNYLSAPDVIVIDSITGEKIESGLLEAQISGTSISSINIIQPPKGLPSNIVEIKSINNTNGIAIQSVASSSSGIVTCSLVTPITGFGIEPFTIGDRIFVEGIQKNSIDGDGFNSADYGYQFFTVSNYINSGTDLQRKLEFNVSGLTTNPGIAKTVQESYSSIVNYKNYPKFEVLQSFSEFFVDEKILVKNGNEFIDVDLRITQYNKSFIKLTGSYKLSVGDIILGKESGSIATINNLKLNQGQFEVDYSTNRRFGWTDNIGKLDENSQVIPDNDYYQNLSYSVKSLKGWEDIVTPVNSILHTSGLKNFADTEIISSSSAGVGSSFEYTNVIYNIIDERRVDTINNFDLATDIDANADSSKFLKLFNKRLSDYVELRTNRVLQIDDISSQFFNSNGETILFTGISDIIPSEKYNKFLVQITSNTNNISQVQFSEIVTINDDDDVYTLSKGNVTNTDELIADIEGTTDGFGNFYLKFSPTNPFDFDYEIKVLSNKFSTLSPGISTSSVGFVDLIGSTIEIESGITKSIVSKPLSNIEALYSNIHILNTTTNEMNYVELYVDHDGVNTYITEYYFDSDSGLSGNYIGSFGASISGGVLSLSYTNTTDNQIILRSKNVGFGSTSVGIGTYRFKSLGQVDGFERSVTYNSGYSNVSSASTIITLSKTDFTSIKSTVRVSIGETSALHQVMLIHDGSNIHTMQYPFLSVGGVSGIGTFGGEFVGDTVSLKFYPDPDVTGNVEILNFSESFYTIIDTRNSPDNLEYSNVVESVDVFNYFGTNTESSNKLNFDLNYQGYPIFEKVINFSNSNVINLATGEFNVPNHFFNTGEELIYTPGTSFLGTGVTSVGIGSTLNSSGIVTSILPSKVFAIKITNDIFKLSTRKDYANVGISVTFTSVGEGNAHTLEMAKKNEKTIITIDNLIQSPIAFTLITHNLNNGGLLDSEQSIIPLSGISSISINDILKIDNEYMKVDNVGLGTTNSGPITFTGSVPLVDVRRGFVGSAATTHNDSSVVNVYRGSYNIVGNEIYFTQPPQGNSNSTFVSNLDNLDDPKSTFSGRVFLRKNYDENQVYDDISVNFTGIGQTYLLTSQGISTVGLGTSGGNGIVLINGIFQTPSTENNPSNNYSIQENTPLGISNISFSGITSSNGSIVISDYDINNNQLPRGGIIVSLGSTPGLGYAPLVGAAVTAIVSSGSIIGLGIGTIGNYGSGYRNPVSIGITDPNHTGVAATITAIVGAGGTLSFNIIGGGTGYVNPTIQIPPPSYENLPVTGVSRLSVGATTDTGIGLLLNVEVGASSTTGIGSTLFEVSSFKVTRPGYGFQKGDVVRPVGLVTAYGLPSPVEEFELTILDTFTDSFSAWQFGQIDFIDSIKNLQNGIRSRFPLFYNSQLLSFEKNSNNLDSQLIDFDSVLIIFINGVLQEPKLAYQFSGGTSFTFTTPPKPEDNVSIFFYRGSPEDSSFVDTTETLKAGDNVQVLANNNILSSTIQQDIRTISNIAASDKIETILYTGQGIDEVNAKPLSWLKQKSDKIIDGNIVSKSRDSIETQIYPTAKIIRDFTSTDTQMFVDDFEFFNYGADTDYAALIVSGNDNFVSAAVTAIVSVGGTIQSLSITNPGSGYVGPSIQVSISAPQTIGVGIGTIAEATISVVNGSLTTPITITNPGLGYTSTKVPQVLVPSPSPVYENISDISPLNTEGFSGNIIGIKTAVGIGTALAIEFTLDSTLAPFSGLSVGYPIYVFDTKVGNGANSIYTSNSSVVGVGTTFLDNIYNVSAFSASTGIITCNVASTTSIVGIATTGPVAGKMSWGRLFGFTRASSPISIAVSSYTTNIGLTTFPTIQRRGIGLRDNGSLYKTL